MIEVLINKRHGGFGISTEAAMMLINANSALIKRLSFKDFFGKDELSQDDVDDMHTTDIGNGFFTDHFGTIYHPETETVYLVEYQDDTPDYLVKMRSHPELIAIFDEIGSERFSGKYAKIKKVIIADTAGTINVADIGIGEYDGSEWVYEKHRTWS